MTPIAGSSSTASTPGTASEPGFKRRPWIARSPRGADPESDAALTLHARRLIAPDTRRRLARSLRTAAVLSETPIRRGVPLRAYGRHVFLARRQVCALADRLEQPDAVDLRGVALVRLLLTDAGGPLHHNRGAELSIAAAREALAALDPATLR
jgi:hypothetical protein